jgi:hypothetical protein
MNEKTVELFVHGAGAPQVINAQLNERLAGLLERLGALPAEGQFVFVGEAEEAIAAPQSDEDVQQPANLELTIEELELHRHRHVHTRAVRRVEVIVYFNGPHHRRRFSPAATVATVTNWAKDRFHIDAAAGADLVLSRRPDGYLPRPDEHLGELLAAGSHSLEFDLVLEVNPQGYREW